MSNLFNYKRLARNTRRQIDRAGMPITIVVMQTVPNAEAWKAPTVTEVFHPAKGVFINTVEKYENGTLVQKASQKIVFYLTEAVAQPDLEADISGYIIRKTEKWKFAKLKVVKPADVLLVYSAEVTK